MKARHAAELAALEDDNMRADLINQQQQELAEYEEDAASR